jgi:glycosyltransferase involved in cell wall biosynthesis
MHVLGISYSRNIFANMNGERVRMRECAAGVEALHLVVFAKSSTCLSDVHDGNLHLYPTGGATKIGMVWRAWRIGRRIIRESSATVKSDWVVTTQDPFEAGFVGYLIARTMGVQVNIQEHGDFFSTPHWRQESFLNSIRYVVGKCLLRQADSVRVVSARMLATMKRLGVGEGRLRLLSVSVPLERFLEAPTANLARQLFPADSIIILSVARFVPQKNLGLLMTAFADVVKREPRARLLLIGTGSEEGVLRDRATQLGLLGCTEPLVHFLPWTDDVPGYMKSSDIYALSSNYEGYARVLLEAMASGLPIVTTDVGCVGSVCINGTHAQVVPVGDTVAYAYALRTLIINHELRSQLGEAGVATARSLQSGTPDYATVWRSSLA